MRSQHAAAAHAVRGPNEPRARLLAAMPATERRLELAGVSTSVLEGGAGPPIVLLHGPGEFAVKWLRVLPGLVAAYRVIAPDLPGHGASEVKDGRLDADQVCAWLGALIDETCASPPALVGHVLGGALAVRFASRAPDRVSRLVLVDSLALAPFRPTPRFALAMIHFMARPSAYTYERFMPQCMHDFDRLRTELGEHWPALLAYCVERARAPSAQAAIRQLMRNVGLPAIPAETLARNTVPTTLIWGRHDRANRLAVAETASARYGWPLHVIEDAADDPILEQPESFLSALRAALAGRGGKEVVQ